MGLFDKLKRNLKQADFSSWLDKHLSCDLSDGIVAVNFNLYDGENQTYDVEFVGCGSFDENDEDWACDEVFTTRGDLFSITQADNTNWQYGLSSTIALVKNYLDEGKYADKLKSYKAVGVGFVGGNIKIVYHTKCGF